MNITAPANLKRVITRWEVVGMSLNGVIGSGVCLLADAATIVAGVWAGVMITFGAAVSIGGNAANTTVVPPEGDLDEIGGPCRTRTYDQKIKSLLLYQLS